MTSASPTVTSVRVKNMVNGGISTFFDVMEEFMVNESEEDSILYQVKNRPGGKKEKVVFYGDHMWTERFGKIFDRSKGYPAHNLKDFDTLD